MTEQTRRASRLIEIERLLHSRPQGYSCSELARELGYSTRTIQRDIMVLQSELNVPVVDAPGRRYALMTGAPRLAPVRFTLQEARAIYLATRLFLRHADERDSDGISALEKVAEALPEPVGRQIVATVDELKNRPMNRTQEQVLRALTEGWAGLRRVTITYRSQQAQAVRETVLEPYLFEPSASGAATYVIGFSHAHGAVRTFKIDRIEAADLAAERFVPQDVEAIRRRLGESWGVVYGDEQYRVVIEFRQAVAARIAETTWHPSQKLIPIDGGGIRLELSLPSLLEFVPWVRSWGPEALVVAPDELRLQVAASLQEAASRYAG